MSAVHVPISSAQLSPHPQITIQPCVCATTHNTLEPLRILNIPLCCGKRNRILCFEALWERQDMCLKVLREKQDVRLRVLQEKQDVCLKVWQEKQERLYKQQGATRSYRPKLYWTIQQESSQMTQFLSIWFEIDACTACSDFNPSGHDSYPLAYIGSTFEEGCFTQPCCTSMRLLHTSNEITQEQSGLFPLREIWKIGASSLQIINIVIRQAQ